MLGREGALLWGVRAEPLPFPAPCCSPGRRIVTERPPKTAPLRKKCRGLLATSPGLAGTLLAAVREGTLTSAGRSRSAPQRPGSERSAPGAQRRHPGSRQGSDTRVPRGGTGQGGHRCAESWGSPALYRQSSVSHWKGECLGEGNGAGQRGSPTPGAAGPVPGRRQGRANISRRVTHCSTRCSGRWSGALRWGNGRFPHRLLIDRRPSEKCAF